MTLNDRRRRKYLGENYALWSDRELAEDSRAESDPITAYPDGISIMGVSDEANWNGLGVSGFVITDYTSDVGSQRFVTVFATEYKRYWVGSDWGDWETPVTAFDIDAINSTIILKSGDKLELDSREESFPIDLYPSGISIMPVSAAADWDGWSTNATVTTHRTSDGGWQSISVDTEGGNWAFRVWESDNAAWQTNWYYPKQALEAHTNVTDPHAQYLKESDFTLAQDAHAEIAAITAYSDSISIMPVTSGANWGPNTGEAGYVVTERNGSTGKQTFVVPEVEASWVRYYESGGPWGDWTFFPSMADVEFAIDTALSDLHFNALTPEDINSHAESDVPDDYEYGMSFFYADTTSDWGPNDNQSGIVSTWIAFDGTVARVAVQTFIQFSDGVSYTRYYMGGVWGEWQGPTLEEGSHTEADPITDYPEGISSMRASAAASWIALDSDLTVTTHRTGDGGWQTTVWYDTELGDSRFYWRLYDGSWGTWATAVVEGHINISSLTPLDTDYAAEDDGHGSYETGLSVFEVSDTANWNGLGHWGFVTTLKISNVLDQTLFDQSTGTIYHRYSNSGSNSLPAWSAWSSGGGGLDQATADTLYKAIGYTPTGTEILAALGTLKSTSAVAESASPSSWGLGLNLMRAVAADNYGPNSSQAGLVVTHVFSGASYATQHFTQDSDGVTYFRFYTTGAWDVWQNTSVSDASASSKGITKLSTAPVSSTNPIAVGDNDPRNSDTRTPTDGTVTSAKLATALANIISGKLDTSAYTAADVLSKFLTVDGSGSGTDADLLDGAHLSALMQASTYVGGDGKILVGVLPDTVVGGMDYQGTWNASTNSPSLSDAGTGRTKGDYYKVATAGATSLNSITDWKIGDWAVWNGTAWDKIDNTDSVSSVDGQTGAVSLSSTYKAIGYVPTWTEITSKPTTFAPIIGSGAADAVAGNDSRLTDTRTPTDGSVTSAKLATALANIISGKLDISDGRVLSQNENDAAQGTSGAPSDTNRFVTDADQRLQSARAAQTIGAAGAIAVGSDEVIPVTATADRTGVTVNAGGYSGQIISVVNRSAFSLTFDVTDATSRVVGGGAVAPNARYTLVWDADFGGAGVGRWIRLPIDTIAGIASMRTLGTGAAQALPGNHSSTTDARAPTTREFEAVFFFGSTLTTQVGVGKFKLPNSGTPTITEVTISVNTLPTGASVICDLNSVNNSTNAKTTLYSTQGNRPTIAAGGNYSNVATLPNTTQPGAGIEISVDIDQVGSPVAGSDLVVIARGTY